MDEFEETMMGKSGGKICRSRGPEAIDRVMGSISKMEIDDEVLTLHLHPSQCSTPLPHPVSCTLIVAYALPFAFALLHLQLSKSHRVHTFLALQSTNRI